MYDTLPKAVKEGKITHLDADYIREYQFQGGQGNFRSLLWKLIHKADLSNQRKIEKGFPDHVATVKKYWDGQFEDVIDACTNELIQRKRKEVDAAAAREAPQ